MKKKIVLFSVLAVFVLFAVIAVSSALADRPPSIADRPPSIADRPPSIADRPPSKIGADSSVWFDPEDSSAEYCETVDVDVWIQTVVPSAGFYGVFDYTFCCANVTKFVGNTTNWGIFCEANLIPPGHVIITAATMGENPANQPVHIGTLTIHCCDETSSCLTDLVWDTSESYIEDPDDNEITPVAWHDGTFACESQGKPDLEIVEKGEEWVNETHYTVSYVIHNNGTAVAPACHNTTLYVDGVAIEHKHVPVALAYCETYTDTFDTTIECTGDSDTIRVCADNYEVIDELDETNNCLENEWICKEKKPDLEIVEKGEEWVNETHYNVSYTIHNKGTAIAPACHNTTLYVDGVAIEHKHVPVALAYCETYTDTFDTTIECTGDSDIIRVCADNYEVIDELDETNNCLENEWICKEKKPDLEIVEKGEEWVNETHYNVSYTIHNKGTAIAPACHNTTLYVDGVAIEHKHVPVALAYCETYTDTFDTTIECTGDSDIIRVCADNYEVIDELDETNNCLENEWICKEKKPDLEIVEKGEEWVNETHYNVSYTIHNKGTAIAPACHNTTLYVDGVAIEHKHVPVALAYCETYTDTFDTTIECTGDSDIIRVCADNYEVIDELDETNNCLENEWICKEKKPDLTVTEITVNYDASSLGGLAIGPEPGTGVHTECNNLSAVIEEENGVDVLASFDVTFKVDGTTLCTVLVPSLTGGANKTVYCNCCWSPYAGDVFAINVTADSNHEIPETNETDNTKWNNGTAVSNGYKGDGWQGPDKNLINVQCHDQDTNNLIYSVGDSYYAKGNWSGTTNYVANWTTSDLPVPEGADIQKAWLYMYYSWDKNEIMPDGASLTFNGPNVLLARQYSDRKGFGTYNYPYGMLVYDVTAEFVATATNTAVLTKATPDTYIPIKGMLLMVVYKHPDEPERIICIDEGYDMINAQASYAVTPEEATTYAPFECCEPIPLSEIGKATLVAIAPGASKGDDKNRLSFNDGLWKGAWDGFPPCPPGKPRPPELGIAEEDVRRYLKADGNVANFQDRGDWMEASNAFLILEKGPKPDLTVTEITVNYDAPSLKGIAIGPEPGPGVHTECNNLSAVIEEENGVDVLASFDVTFEVDGTTLCTVLVPGLTGGANRTVYCNCSWYPMAGDDFAINVTVDSNHEIPETNETDNTKWNNGTAVSNGYKGDGWQGPDKNLINVQCHDQDTINLIYSVGDSYYAKGNWSGTTNYVANWTTSDLPVPEGADIEKAWLYVYYSWDKNGIMPNGVSLTFNGPNVLRARQYSDRKGFGTYNYPYGMLVYDVTNEFNATGNTAVLTKATPDTYIPIKGMLLMVVYKHPDEPERIICIDEGYDMINAQASYAVTPEEATTYAPFECCEPIPLSEIGKATLVAIAPGASKGDDKNRLSFNDGLWKGAWDGFPPCPPGKPRPPELGIAEEDVRRYLKADGNVANFQDRGDWMEASNAFLILEKEAPCPAEYAVYQAKVGDPEGRLNELRALRDEKLDDGYVDSYYEHSPALTLVLSRADSDLVTDGAQLLSRYSIPVGQHVQGMDVNERISKQDVEEALSFTDRLKREVMKNRDAIGVKSTEAIIDFIDEFEGQVKASEGKTFSAALKSSIYYESGQLRVGQEIVEK